MCLFVEKGAESSAPVRGSPGELRIMAYRSDYVYKGLKKLIGSERAGKFKYGMHEFAKGVPFLGGFVSSADNYQFAKDYLKNRGLSFNDIKYGGLGMGLSSGAITNFVSNNIDKLYGDKPISRNQTTLNKWM